MKIGKIWQIQTQFVVIFPTWFLTLPTSDELIPATDLKTHKKAVHDSVTKHVTILIIHG